MSAPTDTTTGFGLSRPLLLLLALTCGIAVGNVYFPQAMSPVVAADLHLTDHAAAGVVTATQVGYAVGIFLLVPLGDRLPHRRLIVILLCLTGLTLLAAGLASTPTVLFVAAACVGISTVLAPIIAVMAVGLVPAARRGAVTGTLLSGSIGGILLARSFGGLLGQHYGWRAPYLVAAALAAVLAAVLGRLLPRTTTPPPAQEEAKGYLTLLAEPLRLLRTERALQRSACNQAMIFAGFSAVWTALALLLTGRTYRLGPEAVGLIALVGAATMLCTPRVGALIDRDGSDRVNHASMLGAIAAAAVLALGALGGATGLAALVLGTLILDIAMQSGMVANQVRFFALAPEARSRLNTAYMTCAYLGGSAGSWLGARTYSSWGWLGPCALLATLAAAALTHLLRRYAPLPRPGATAPAPDTSG